MFKFFKILFLLLLLAALAIVGSYLYYKDILHQEARMRIEREVSRISGYDVTIGSISYVPLQTISLKGVEFTPRNSPLKDPGYLGSIDITFNTVTAVKNKQLLLTVSIDQLDYNGIKGNILFRSSSSPADDYKQIISPELLQFVNVIEADITIKKQHIKNISGNIDIKDLNISKGKLHLSHGRKDYVLSFLKIPEERSGYSISLRSYDLDLRSDIIHRDNNILLENLTGTFQSVAVDLDGKIIDFADPVKRTFYFTGTLESDIESLAAYPGTHTKFIENNNITGLLRSDIDLVINDQDRSMCNINSDIFLTDLVISNMHIDNLRASACITDNKIIVPDFTAALYKGSVSGALHIAIPETSPPSATSVKIVADNINLGYLLDDLSDNPYNVSGMLNLEADLYLDPGGNPLKAMPRRPGTIFKQLSRYEGDVNFEITDPVIRNIRLDDLNGRINITDGILKIPSLKGTFYEGLLATDIVLDLNDDSLPYTFTYAVSGVNLSKLVSDINRKSNRIYGTLNSELYVKGFAISSSTAEGSGNIYIKDANLGPMPLLAPLIGDLYSSIQTILGTGQPVNINSAYADFFIKDRKIMTDNMILTGKDINIFADGYVDFDGKLDFSFQNQFKEPDAETHDEWQNFLRTSIVKFGKYISKARLTGTVYEPHWDFEYLVHNIITDNIKKFLKGISE